MEETADHHEPVFRPSKRRKLFRKRQSEDGAVEDTPLQAQSPAQLQTTDDNDPATQNLARNADEVEDDAVSGLRFRQRKAVGTKKGGIAFSSAATQATPTSNHDSEEARALVPTQNASEVASTRFMAPTGQVVTSDDKHMMAYIDSQLARIRSTDTESNSDPVGSTLSTTSSLVQTPDLSSPSSGQLATRFPQRQGTGEASQSSKQKAAGQGQPQVQSNPRPKPPRLGRDGKPLRPRKDRNRRTSLDIARDAMVEQVLRESRLDIYDASAAKPAPTGTKGAGLDEDADERMAAEFRRDFIAAQQDRIIRKPPPPPPGAKGESSKGPKLGGSRSQRAAMHAAMEEQAAAKGKK